MGLVQWAIDSVINFFKGLLNVFLLLLPDSPFQQLTYDLQKSPLGDVMSYINYFIPIGEMLIFLTSYLFCVAIWYGVRWALRLARYIE